MDVKLKVFCLILSLWKAELVTVLFWKLCGVVVGCSLGFSAEGFRGEFEPANKPSTNLFSNAKTQNGCRCHEMYATEKIDFRDVENIIKFKKIIKTLIFSSQNILIFWQIYLFAFLAKKRLIPLSCFCMQNMKNRLADC